MANPPDVKHTQAGAASLAGFENALPLPALALASGRSPTLNSNADLINLGGTFGDVRHSVMAKSLIERVKAMTPEDVKALYQPLGKPQPGPNVTVADAKLTSNAGPPTTGARAALDWKNAPGVINAPRGPGSHG